MGQLSLPAKLSKNLWLLLGQMSAEHLTAGKPKVLFQVEVVVWCFPPGTEGALQMNPCQNIIRQILSSSLAEDCFGSSVLLTLPWAFCCHLCKFSTWTKLGLGMIWHKLWQSHAICSPVVVNFSHMASIPPISTCSICNLIHLHHLFQGAYPSK